MAAGNKKGNEFFYSHTYVYYHYLIFVVVVVVVRSRAVPKQEEDRDQVQTATAELGHSACYSDQWHGIHPAGRRECLEAD